MPAILVTGANRGIGLEFARQYAAAGWRVHATCRAPEGATDLALVAGDVARHRLDVEDPETIARVAAELDGEAIDVLVCNAGIYGPRGLSALALDYAVLERVLRVNVAGPLRVAAAFVDHVAASDEKKMIAMSSLQGSLAAGADGSIVYRTSKAALNMAWSTLATELAPRGIVTAAISPGWVRTDMGGPNAALSVETSVSSLRRTIADLDNARSGGFFDRDGNTLPW